MLHGRNSREPRVRQHFFESGRSTLEGCRHIPREEWQPVSRWAGDGDRVATGDGWSDRVVATACGRMKRELSRLREGGTGKRPALTGKVKCRIGLMTPVHALSHD